MNLPRLALLPGLMLAVLGGPAQAQKSGCRVEPFQGATMPQGAQARMHVAPSAGACAIVNYGAPVERANPAETGTITKAPAHGTAEFIAPRAIYTPAPGYVGEDEFEYTAFARGRLDTHVRLKVRVRVSVAAP